MAETLRDRIYWAWTCRSPYLKPKLWPALVRDHFYRKQFKPGVVIDTCKGHPAILIRLEDDNTVVSYSLLDHTETMCDFYNCGVTVLTPDEIIQMIKDYDREGEFGLLRRRGWTRAQYEAFKAEWR